MNQLRSTGALDGHPNLRGVADAVMMSGEADATMDFWLGMQPQLRQLSKQKVEPSVALFNEPNPSQLYGDIHLGNTIPSRHPVQIPLEFFGNTGQIAILGGIGSGKSTLMNSMGVQLIEQGIPVTIYDVLDQCAKPMLSVVSKEKLGVVSFRHYQRNNCQGPEGLDTLTWLEAIEDHLSEGLKLEGPSFDELMDLAEDLESSRQVVSFRNMLIKLQQKKRRSPTEGTLYRRLRALKIKAPGLFVDEGIDLDRFFSLSMILELKQANNRVRTLTYGDHFGWLTHSAPTLNRWKLRRVLMFHEASVLLSRGGDDDSWRKNIVRLGRNLGVGLVLADQTPQKQDPVVRQNIGLKCFLRQDDEEGIVKYRKVMGGLNDEQMHYILNLLPRRMIVKMPGIKFPFEVEIPKL